LGLFAGRFGLNQDDMLDIVGGKADQFQTIAVLGKCEQ
jgi:hypothetical protein